MLLAHHTTIPVRMPRKDEGLEVGYFDFSEAGIGDFHPLGESFAWNYHKGCRLQWLDGEHVIFNSGRHEWKRAEETSRGR